MRIGEMTATDCREILTRISLGRLGCSREDQPYVVTIYFVYEPDHLYGFATDDQNRPIKPFYFHDRTRFKCGSTDQNPCAHSSRCLRKRRTLRNNSVGRS
jgi:nitroimidazol reductase NimA-like FMN-containing flavoprotein (pyridoxamine 5'-phosphate oxidase superfamily)